MEILILLNESTGTSFRYFWCKLNQRTNHFIRLYICLGVRQMSSGALVTVNYMRSGRSERNRAVGIHHIRDSSLHRWRRNTNYWRNLLDSRVENEIDLRLLTWNRLHKMKFIECDRAAEIQGHGRCNRAILNWIDNNIRITVSTAGYRNICSWLQCNGNTRWMQVFR